MTDACPVAMFGPGELIHWRLDPSTQRQGGEEDLTEDQEEIREAWNGRS